MLRWVLFSLLVIVVAALGTVASQFVGSGETESAPKLVGAPADKHDHHVDGPPGKAVVEGGSTKWDFGVLPTKTEGSHDWTIVNKGEGDLLLEMGQTSCSCTYSDMKLGDLIRLKPGEKKTIKVSFNTKEWNEFNQTAPVMVHNDPEIQEITLTITGHVRPAVMTYPVDKMIAAGQLDTDRSVTKDVALWSSDRPNVKILEVTSSNPDVISTKVRDMTKEECEQFKITEGRVVALTLKPSVRLGNFTEELSVKLDHPKQESVKFTISGNRVGPISVFPERVRLFNVAAKQGATQTLTLLVRGRENTKFTVDKAPKSIGVEVAPAGSMTTDGGGKAQKYQVTVTVAPNTAPGSIIGEVLLKTDHPSASEIKIPVSVVVGQAG